MISFGKNTKRILIGLIALAYAGLFFSIPISNITLLLLLLFCVLQTPLAEYLRSFKAHPLLTLVTASYLLLLLGLLYTTNLPVGYFILEKRAGLLLIPLLAMPLFLRMEIGKDPVLFRIIGLITLFTSVALLLIGGYNAWILKDPNAFYFETFTRPFIHYVYYAIYFAVGMLCFLDSLFDQWIQRRLGVFWLLLLFVYSLGFLILVASKTGVLAFSAGSVILLYRRLQSRKIFLLSLFTLALSASVFLYFNDTTRSRFTELTQNLSILTRDQLGDWNEEVITGLNMRLLFWKISVVHIVKDGMILWGTGTGDTQDYLDALYTNPVYNRRGYVGWDTHNQWVFTFVQLGLAGVAVWAALYFIYARKAHRANDLKFLAFLLVTFAFSMSESILESNKGIIYFGLFFTLFASRYGSTAPTENQKPEIQL
ncbi:MAG: O-antigen ligase family protein [Cyclobacteriaceae bacterium]|nr:O-antigen ligase family protein [Cyclobacteriaceae bacterium]